MRRINEIFYSLQGEGLRTGVPAVFVRFAGCNLRCPFCDTDFGEYVEMSDEEIVAAAARYAARYVILTGGEPALQADVALVDRFHAAGFVVAIETNGTVEPPSNVDWVTCSPKGHVVLRRCDELKCLYDGRTEPLCPDIEARYRLLQPIDSGDAERNRATTAACVEYVKSHPGWRLSLQTHKMIGIR